LISLLSKLLVAGVAAAQVAIPPLHSRVTDLTGTLDAQQRGALEQTLAEFEARKGAQIAVLIVPTTQPETLEQYAVRVEESWKLGRKGVDDSVLLLIAKDDGKIRLEVGYGLEGVLPDAAAKRIIEDDITPRFKQGDFYGGIRAGVDRMMRTIEGESLPSPKAQEKYGYFDLETTLGICFFLVVALGAMLRRVLGRILATFLVGGAIWTVIWLTTANTFFAWMGAFAAFWLTALGNTTGWRYAGVGRFGGGGGSSGGSSWGGSGGGGFSGGGFSGGGGSSGGGGASGSW